MKNVKESFNFLYTGHWLQGKLGEDRKDTGMLIKVFLETFKDKKNVWSNNENKWSWFFCY